MTEGNLTKKILLELARKYPNLRLFRNNTGTGWQGKIIKHTPSQLILENPRPLRAGLIKGSSDLIGLQSIEITPEMVGQKFAVFTALEVKTQKGKASPEQINFIEFVKKFGGNSGVIRETQDAIKILNNTTKNE
jgi:hypothetical protein